MILKISGGGLCLILGGPSGVPPMARWEGKTYSVSQSIHWKCQRVIERPSLAPRCCSPSDQYPHYPNYAVGWARSPRELMVPIERDMLALGCEVEVEVVVVGSDSRLLRAAGGAWQRVRVWPSRDNFFFFFFYNCHQGSFEYFMKQSEARASVGYIDDEELARLQRWNWEVQETALWGCTHSTSVGVLFKRLSCHFFWHWETVFFFSRQQRRNITHNRDEMLSWSNGGKIRTCPNWRLTHIFYTTNLV